MKIGGSVSQIWSCLYFSMSDYGEPCHVTKIKKYLFTGFGLCFALENSSKLLHCIKEIHIGHSLTLFCIRTAVILIFVIVRL